MVLGHRWRLVAPVCQMSRACLLRGTARPQALWRLGRHQVLITHGTGRGHVFCLRMACPAAGPDRVVDCLGYFLDQRAEGREARRDHPGGYLNDRQATCQRDCACTNTWREKKKGPSW